MLAGTENKARTVLENWNCHYISYSGTSIDQCPMFKFIANAERMKTLQFLQISVGIGFREMNVTKHKNRWLPLWMCTLRLYALISLVYFFYKKWKHFKRKFLPLTDSRRKVNEPCCGLEFISLIAKIDQGHLMNRNWWLFVAVQLDYRGLKYFL